MYSGLKLMSELTGLPAIFHKTAFCLDWVESVTVEFDPKPFIGPVTILFTYRR